MEQSGHRLRGDRAAPLLLYKAADLLSHREEDRRHPLSRWNHEPSTTTQQVASEPWSSVIGREDVWGANDVA